VSRERLALAAFRALLWLGVVTALVFAGLLAWSAISRRIHVIDEQVSNDLPDMSAVAAAGLTIVGLLLAAVALPWLLALRRRRPWLAATALAITVCLWLADLYLQWGDVRDERDCSELGIGTLVLPAWLTSILLLATSRAGASALALARRPVTVAVHWLVIAALGAAALTNAGCLFFCEPGADAALASLTPGTWSPDVFERLEPACSLEWTRGAPGGDLRVECQPEGPPLCACVPAPTRTALLHFDDENRLVSVTPGHGVGGVRRRR
jgi:hypothetical protein